MSDTLYVKPSKPGLIVRDPETTEALPPKGGRVPNDSYWRRRLAAGDVRLRGEEQGSRRSRDATAGAAAASRSPKQKTPRKSDGSRDARPPRKRKPKNTPQEN